MIFYSGKGLLFRKYLFGQMCEPIRMAQKRNLLENEALCCSLLARPDQVVQTASPGAPEKSM